VLGIGDSSAALPGTSSAILPFYTLKTSPLLSSPKILSINILHTDLPQQLQPKASEEHSTLFENLRASEKLKHLDQGVNGCHAALELFRTLTTRHLSKDRLTACQWTQRSVKTMIDESNRQSISLVSSGTPRRNTDHAKWTDTEELMESTPIDTASGHLNRRPPKDYLNLGERYST